jgi:hypothetical protein
MFESKRPTVTVEMPWIKWVGRLAGGIILKLAYGYTTLEHDDPFVQQAEIALAQFSVAAMPGAFLVDTIPWRPSFLQRIWCAHD